MPSKDPIKAKEREKRYKQRKRIEKYGYDAPDQRGRHGNHLRGEQHYRWNGGRTISDSGYIKISVGKDHPLADPIGYVYEHLLVWVNAGNPKPQPGYVLHHKNGNKTDNRLDNLELLTYREHVMLHNNQRDRDIKGRFVD